MKVAFISAFYGAQAAGGAEAECRQTAHHLVQRGVNVEILTTCLLDLQHDWNIDAYPAGTSHDGEITIRRFQTDKVDRLAFDRLNEPLMQGRDITAADGEQFAALHINSPDLYRYLAAHANDYDWLCFIPYLFGTAIHGSRIAPDRSILIPCLHDEGYARIRPVNEMFRRVARIVFHTEAEKRLATRLYGDPGPRGMVIGEGVATNLSAEADRFRNKHQLHDPFVLYCGRKDQSKNTPELIEYFIRYKREFREPLKLLLIGPGSASIPGNGNHDVIDLGYLPYQDKLDAYAASTIFCQPSKNESFSLVLMEAWDLAKAALVHADCDVMKDHVVAAGGGLYYRSAAEFAACLRHLATNPTLAVSMGQSAQKYVRAHYAWDHIMDLYLNAVFAK